MVPQIPQTAYTDHQKAKKNKKKQPAEADQLSQAIFDTETNSALMQLCTGNCVKILDFCHGQ